MERLKICMLVFPNLTALDFIGPFDVFARAPEHFEIFVTSEKTELIQTEGGLHLKPAFSLETCPPCDILFVPGGRGVTALLEDENYLKFIREQGHNAKYITSVCTGSLLLAVSGLLNGYKATTHWRSLDLLRMLAVDVVEERVVVDRNRITGGGITAGIDFALTLVSMLCGDAAAKMIQLSLEYSPAPPFQSGSPKTSDVNVVEKVLENTRKVYEERLSIIQKIRFL